MAEEKVIVQQVDKKKIKGVSDIVFCIDASGSMRDVIEGLKQHINNFVDKLNSNQQISSLDLRLGIIAYDHRNFYKEEWGFKKIGLNSVLTALMMEPFSGFATALEQECLGLFLIVVFQLIISWVFLGIMISILYQKLRRE